MLLPPAPLLSVTSQPGLLSCTCNESQSYKVERGKVPKSSLHHNVLTPSTAVGPIFGAAKCPVPGRCCILHVDSCKTQLLLLSLLRQCCAPKGQRWAGIRLFKQKPCFTDTPQRSWHGIAQLTYGPLVFVELMSCYAKGLCAQTQYGHFYWFLPCEAGLDLWSLFQSVQTVCYTATGTRRMRDKCYRAP